MKFLGSIAASLLLAVSVNASDIKVYEMKDSKAVNHLTVGAMFKSMNYSVEAVSQLDKKFKKFLKTLTLTSSKLLQ